MKRYAARRDSNERAIIEALVAAGAAVQQLEPPLPDLLVSYRGVLHLLEVKDHDPEVRTRPHRGKGNRLTGPMSALTPSQVEWWMHWRGKMPAIVHTVAEALAAVGVAYDEDQIAQVMATTGIDRAGAERAIRDGKRLAAEAIEAYQRKVGGRG